VVVLATEAARTATAEILELHSIPAPVSRDLAELLPPEAARAVEAAHAATATVPPRPPPAPLPPLPPPPPPAGAELAVRSRPAGHGSKQRVRAEGLQP